MRMCIYIYIYIYINAETNRQIEKVRIFHWTLACEKEGKLPLTHGRKNKKKKENTRMLFLLTVVIALFAEIDICKTVL